MKHTWQSVISGFRRAVNELCTLLGCYAASNGNPLPTFRDNVSVPFSWPLNMVTICWPETPIDDHHSTLRNTPEVRWFHTRQVHSLSPVVQKWSIYTACKNWLVTFTSCCCWTTLYAVGAPNSAHKPAVLQPWDDALRGLSCHSENPCPPCENHFETGRTLLAVRCRKTIPPCITITSVPTTLTTPPPLTPLPPAVGRCPARYSVWC
jgi:hypothetical protein